MAKRQANRIHRVIRRLVCKNISGMSLPKSSYTFSLQVQKGNLSIENSVKNSVSPWIQDTPLNYITSLPLFLEPTIHRAIALPLQLYNLQLNGIMSVAILGRNCQDSQYLAPLDSRIILNHWDPIYYADMFSCCKWDESTIITLQQNAIWK